MFTITPATTTQVKEALDRNLTLSLTDDHDESTWSIRTEIIETLTSASEGGFYMLSDCFYQIINIMDDHWVNYPTYCNQIIATYSDLFSETVAQDIATNWEQELPQNV